MFEFIEIDEKIRKKVCNFIAENWGSPVMVSRGKKHFIDKLPGCLAMRENDIIGLITYNIIDDECEIVSLDSNQENLGIGTKLINLVIDKARKSNCRRVWLITTNDNTKAIRFYQKRGFNMKALHLNAVVKARKIKPEIPLYGFDNIPILHEIEFEKLL
ncbi:Acetyltransferase (GNAT) family protein [Caloranaerobacter azorensis DSM 13643]|uniref:Acetyltransferase (GNAT) family protein n=1 Tax=Caloranaerobacter azorensis DSM 13643 TaxID=1121264 RepID=A0A1M5V682_9FIRM|nr:GNAT family N-acetyltransferase [Caloranaerobacter azorensis]SHH70716.1 Acetyltransferase (GNAT) family protein [Caloranaerobacter azorensis DSM 13643]